MSQGKKSGKARRRQRKTSRPRQSAPAPKNRVHLRVIRDEASGSEQLVLSGAVFEQRWQNELVAGAANTAYALFNERANESQAEKLGESAMNATSRLVDNLFAQAGGAVACRAGCDHCCYQSVGVTPPEALRIFAFLNESLSKPQLEELAAKLAEQREATAKLSSQERFSPDHPCPFLKDAECSIYPVRPLSCRGMNSLDAKDCESRLRDRERREAFLKDGFGGRVLLDPIFAAQAISAGMQLALSEHFHVDMRPLDLIAALNLLFTRGLNVAQQWLAGDEGFRSALGGQAVQLAGKPSRSVAAQALPAEPKTQSPGDDLAAIFAGSCLPAASSFMSSRWSQDNLITCHPKGLYTGKVRAQISQDALDQILQQVAEKTGPLVPQAAHMGVYTWDISCQSEDGPIVVQVPLVLDEPGKRKRSRSEVPRLNVANMGHFRERKLTRFAATPLRFLTLDSGIPVAIFTRLVDHHALTFGQGCLQVDLCEGEESWSICLGPQRTADLLTEMVAALVYHYEPEVEGGTAIADVFVNDGDFVAKRNIDGSFDLRLTAMRKRQAGISPTLLLVYLIQMNTFEDWDIDGKLSGVPTLISNPSIAFEGVVRGLRYRFLDQRRPQEDGARLAEKWIEEFALTREGHAYRPWVERFLKGGLAPEFGEDLREHWWRLLPWQQKQNVLELSSRHSGSLVEARSAQQMKALVERLSSEIGRRPARSSEAMRVNDLSREGISALLQNAGIPVESRAEITDQLICQWPFRSLEHLLTRVPKARDLQRLPIEVGRVISDSDEGTLRSLPPLRQDAGRSRLLANPELFGAVRVPASLYERATEMFPSFEAFMDTALFDEKWGYYATRVVIGKGGHFSTHPESLSPRYGEWVCNLAFQLFRDMRAGGEISEDERFSVIEFGAGNGRLARDFLDAVGKKTSTSTGRKEWQAFASRLEYRIYELSPSLREKQQKLVGRDAIISEGDARRPATALKQDFEKGVKGLVVTNEVPDAFGVHKVMLTADGQAFAARVVPRIEPRLREVLGEQLARQVTEVDAKLRGVFDFLGNPADSYLDAQMYARTMEELAGFPEQQRQALLNGLWLEEAYLPASTFLALSEHLRENAGQYATALAAEDSGVVAYINVHASRFIRELARSLTAGAIVTVDYGDTTWGLVEGARRGDFPFRVYLDTEDYVPRPNDPYTAPGTQDMTADVNFTDLARAGEQAGLSVVHYGPERDLAGADLPDLLNEATDESIAAFLGAPIFKVLVLGKGPRRLLTGALATPLSLSHSEKDLPKSRRAMARSIERRLSVRANVQM